MKKINIAELLKDCPKGMELDCAICNNVVTLEGVDKEGYYPIRVKGKNGFHHTFTYWGGVYDNEDSKCVIFPKGKTTWEGFVPLCQFKDGDVVISTSNNIHLISCRDKNNGWESCCGIIYGKFDLTKTAHVIPTRLATEEEKQKLFDAIKAKGYHWNEEIKTLEKLPKFKVGNKIVDILRKHEGASGAQGVISEITDDKYIFTDGSYMSISNQDNWELVADPDKFDINTLVPFESRVLVRNSSCYVWEADIFGRYSDGYITLGGAKWGQCIPYEHNEHLFGTTNDCNDFYKTWEK